VLLALAPADRQRRPLRLPLMSRIHETEPEAFHMIDQLALDRHHRERGIKLGRIRSHQGPVFDRVADALQFRAWQARGVGPAATGEGDQRQRAAVHTADLAEYT